MKRNTSVTTCLANIAQPTAPIRAAQGKNALRQPAILHATGWSRSTLNNRIAAGDFPKPLRTGPRTVAWLESDVGAYFDRLEADRAARSLTNAS